MSTYAHLNPFFCERIMSLQNTSRPQWLTFDCYGTLIQWGKGLRAAVGEMLRRKHGSHVDPARLTGRSLLPDYTRDATLATLDQVPTLFTTPGW